MPNVPAHIVNSPLPAGLVFELQDEIVHQDQKWGIIEGATQTGAVRLGLALIQDELNEALEAWADERPGGYTLTRRETMQVAAMAIRALRDTL